MFTPPFLQEHLKLILGRLERLPVGKERVGLEGSPLDGGRRIGFLVIVRVQVQVLLNDLERKGLARVRVRVGEVDLEARHAQIKAVHPLLVRLAVLARITLRVDAVLAVVALEPRRRCNQIFFI